MNTNFTCKKCGVKITSSSKSGLCRRCVQKGKIHSKETCLKISLGQMGEKNQFFGKHHSAETLAKLRVRRSAETCAKIGAASKGRKHSVETRAKMSIDRSGKNHPLFGKTHTFETKSKISMALVGRHLTPETIEKIRIASSNRRASPETKLKHRLIRINQISRDYFDGNQTIPNWNRIACQKIDEYGKQYGYDFQHAMNGGEFFIKDLGYFVDGYDKEKNTVIEYYERYHDRQVRKDFEREIEICNYLNCDFIILWEK